MMNYIDKICVIRANDAGVFFGRISAIDGDTIEITNCRRLWYWAGAASISQIANDGVSKPEECKFPAPVKKQMIFGVIEIIPASEKSIHSISGVKQWKSS